MTLQSNDLGQAKLAGMESLRAIAQGEARGDAGIGTFAITIATLIAAGVYEMSDVATSYDDRFAWINAEKTRLGREHVEVPTGNSRASQLAKLRTIAGLGQSERTRLGILEVMNTAALLCEWKYKPMVAGAGAMAALLKKEPLASDEALLDAAAEAIDAAKSDKVKSALSQLTRIAKDFDKLVSHEDFGPWLAAAAKHSQRDAYGDVARMMVKALAVAEAYNAAIVLGD